MKNGRKEISSQSDSYLDTLETIYGEVNLHPVLSAEDLGGDFRADEQARAESEQTQALQKWSESYLDTVELLFGELNLHPKPTIEELCEEWKECFWTDGQEQADINRRLARNEWNKDYLKIWPLQPAS